MSYKSAITEANTELGSNPRVRFIGYGLRKGRALGTLDNVNSTQIIETPIAENLMVGMAIGLALKGLVPVVFIERMDFILNALDAIVNHLDKIKTLSRGEFAPAAIIRTVVGNKRKPLYTGLPHIQDFAASIRNMVTLPVIELVKEHEIHPTYKWAREDQARGRSTLLVEYKDLM